MTAETFLAFLAFPLGGLALGLWAVWLNRRDAAKANAPRR